MCIYVVKSVSITFSCRIYMSVVETSARTAKSAFRHVLDRFNTCPAANVSRFYLVSSERIEALLRCEPSDDGGVAFAGHELGAHRCRLHRDLGQAIVAFEGPSSWPWITPRCCGNKFAEGRVSLGCTPSDRLLAFEIAAAAADSDTFANMAGFVPSVLAKAPEVAIDTAVELGAVVMACAVADVLVAEPSLSEIDVANAVLLDPNKDTFDFAKAITATFRGDARPDVDDDAAWRKVLARPGFAKCGNAEHEASFSLSRQFKIRRVSNTHSHECYFIRSQGCLI